MGSKKIVVLTLFFLFAILAAGGCSKKVQPAAAPPGPEKAGVRTIAVMPVENKTMTRWLRLISAKPSPTNFI